MCWLVCVILSYSYVIRKRFYIDNASVASAGCVCVKNLITVITSRVFGNGAYPLSTVVLFLNIVFLFLFLLLRYN